MLIDERVYPDWCLDSLDSVTINVLCTPIVILLSLPLSGNHPLSDIEWPMYCNVVEADVNDMNHQ